MAVLDLALLPQPPLRITAQTVMAVHHHRMGNLPLRENIGGLGREEPPGISKGDLLTIVASY